VSFPLQRTEVDQGPITGRKK